MKKIPENAATFSGTTDQHKIPSLLLKRILMFNLKNIQNYEKQT